MLINNQTYIERARQAVLEALDAFAEAEFKDLAYDYDEVSKAGIGATDRDLTFLFPTIDGHATTLAERYGAVLVDYDPDEVARRDLRAMGNTMHFKGYTTTIHVEAESNILQGKLDGIEDFVGFHAPSVERLRLAFCEAVNDYLATCAEIGKEPQRPQVAP